MPIKILDAPSRQVNQVVLLPAPLAFSRERRGDFSPAIHDFVVEPTSQRREAEIL
jgi:hypothetical protein